MNTPNKTGNLAIVRLGIGEGGIYDKPTRVDTLLGSCVSVVLFAPKAKVGGLFHALLPSWADYKKENILKTPYRFVDTAITQLFQEFLTRGLMPPDIRAKVFGGANSLFIGEVGMGSKNVDVAMETLGKLHLKIVASSVGGTRGRKLICYSHTGEVGIKYLGS